MTQKEDRKMIAALLRERESYVRRGETDRVRQVDEQLAHYGHEPEQADETEPAGRGAAPASTADGDAAAEERRGRGRPRKPRDDAGNIVRD
ncbi:hypothetical protein OTB20_32290 [Streptomyces sp. H27-H1]|uniref:hypothetical protein n=1 Tax=Streptomyces sp. H27-H1 TaxID=2996461 RepID=UPI00226D7C8F|nr:hypothetical protein [Streptomyces sp. H27-H1]MCY0930789.1 hypothetical protein [Streptomyces sp. H27-H1]